MANELPPGYESVPDFQALLDYTTSQSSEMLDALKTLVQHESPSTNKVHLDRCADYLAGRFREIGGAVTRLANSTRGDHLKIRFEAQDGAPVSDSILILCHFDTVWPAGTLETRPFRVEGGRAYGPGIYDMKGGIVIAEYALRTLAALEIPRARPVVVLLNADEEIGTGTSQAAIEALARQAAYTLVLEPAMEDGALKTARKGVGGFTLEVKGRASHAGAEPEAGVSAIQELAHQILRLHRMTDMERGTTVNVGVVAGGMRSNVVAASAKAEIDTRAWTVEDADALEAEILAVGAVNPETEVTVRGGFERPPMERTPGTVALFEAAQEVGRRMGMTLSEGASGGGSDGNFTSALGVPTLDGLGVEGGGAHSVDEFIRIVSLPERAALLAGLLAVL
jgi:glutamate carboxypeptidase